MVTRKKFGIRPEDLPEKADQPSKASDCLLTPEKALVWAKKPSWTLGEALKLARCIDPDLVRTLRSGEVRRVRVSLERDTQRRSMREFAIRAQRAGQLGSDPTPASFLAWLRSHKLPVAQTLLDAAEKVKIIDPESAEAVTRCSGPVGDADEIAPLKARLIELENELVEARRKIANEDIHPRVKANLQSLIAAIAIEKFRWRADKPNPAAANIEKCLRLIGLDLSSETILEHIKEGYNKHMDKFDAYFEGCKDDYAAPGPLKVRSAAKKSGI